MLSLVAPSTVQPAPAASEVSKVIEKLSIVFPKFFTVGVQPVASSASEQPLSES